MSWNGYTVDRHGRAYPRAGRQVLQGLHRPRIPRAVQPACARRSPGRSRRATATRCSAARTAVIEQIEAGRALGVRDTFGLTRPLGDGARPHRLPARPQRPAAADPPGGELGRQGAARGHGQGPGRYQRAVPDACVELLRVARRRLRERALPRLSSLGRRFLRAGAEAAEMDPRRQYARRALGRRRAEILGRARPQPRRRLHFAAGAGRQTARQPRPPPALRRGAVARPAAPGAWRHGAAALRARHARPRRRLVPAARLLATRGPAWRRWAP